MILAQLSVFPVGEGTSLSRFVKKGVKVIKESGYTYEIGGMSTAIEVPDLDALFNLVKKVHQAHVEAGGQRILIDLPWSLSTAMVQTLCGLRLRR